MTAEAAPTIPTQAPPARPAAARPLHVVLVAANPFRHDSRLLRAASALLADGHRVTALGLAAPGLPEREDHASGLVVRRVPFERRLSEGLWPLPPRLRDLAARLIGLDPAATDPDPRAASGADRLRAPLRRLVEILAYGRRVEPWARAAVAAAPDGDVFQAKALVCLPVVRRAAALTGGRYVYDVADLHSESARLVRLPKPLKAAIRRREQGLMRGAAAVLAVTEAMADEVAARLSVARPTVVMNCRPLWRPEAPEPPSSDALSTAAGLTPDRPIVLYQGAFRGDQGIEQLVAALDEPALRETSVGLVFLGFGRLEAWLRDRAADRPANRIVVLPPVDPDDLLELTAGATLSFVGAPPRTRNLELTIPNKFFESLMAGVPVLVSSGTYLCRVTTDHGVGRCIDVESPPAIAAAIAEHLAAPPEERMERRRRARRAAIERFNWEHEQAGLVEVYRALAATPAERRS